jgi:hypothetical protein
MREADMISPDERATEIGISREKERAILTSLP